MPFSAPPTLVHGERNGIVESKRINDHAEFILYVDPRPHFDPAFSNVAGYAVARRIERGLSHHAFRKDNSLFIQQLIDAIV